MRWFLGAVISFNLLYQVAIAAPFFPGPVEALVQRVIDGDTFQAIVKVKVTAKVRAWLDIETEVIGETIVQATIRPRGFDTPETHRPQCPEEKELGLKAKDILASALTRTPITLRNVAYESHGGRVLADVSIGSEGQSLTTVMIESGYARPSAGGRESWCPAEPIITIR